MRRCCYDVVFCFTLRLHLDSTAAAENVATGTFGAEGDHLTWTLSGTGNLSISGYGTMEDYEYFIFHSPWYTFVAVS